MALDGLEVLLQQSHGRLVVLILVHDHFLELGDPLEIGVLGHLVDTVPPGIVRAHHGGAMAGATALVVPDLPPGPFDRLVKGRGGDVTLLLEGGHDGGDRLGELFIIEIDHVVELLVVALDHAGGVATEADALHLGATILPGDDLDHLGALGLVADLGQLLALGDIELIAILRP